MDPTTEREKLSSIGRVAESATSPEDSVRASSPNLFLLFFSLREDDGEGSEEEETAA